MKKKVLQVAMLNAILMMGGSWGFSETAYAQTQVQNYRIEAGDLESVLSRFGTQSRIQLIYPPDLLEGKRSKGLNGQHSPAEALQRLLEGSGLDAERVNETTVVIKKSERPAAVPSDPAATQKSDAVPRAIGPVTNMAEILVKGSRSLNADIRRTVDDAQPYMIFERKDIERSGAINLSEFMLSRVSADVSTAPATQHQGSSLGDLSMVNLRGLGTNQTLILVDGRRLAPTYIGSAPIQPNLNAIPLAAVERIEVLPTTASAIYGGSATGGVINVILRRDYQGGELKVAHDNSFDTDSSVNRVDLSYGFSLGDSTTMLWNASLSEGNLLLKRDRDFRARGIEHAYRHNPDFLSTYRFSSTSANIFSATGTDLVLRDGTPLDSAITYAPQGYLGLESDGGAALVSNAGRINSENDGNAYVSSGGASFGGMSRNTMLSMSLRHSFSESLDGFIDVSASENASRNPDGTSVAFNLAAGHAFNPFMQPIRVMVSSDEFNVVRRQNNKLSRAAVGLIARLGKDWMTSVDFTWSKSTGFVESGATQIDYVRALADGFDPLVDYGRIGGRSLSPYVTGGGVLSGPSSVYGYNPTLRLGGPLWALPAGPVAASLLLEQQKMEFAPLLRRSSPGFANESFTGFPQRSQDVRSAYAELTIPVFSKLNPQPGLNLLDVQLAARYDDYEYVTGDRVAWSPGQPQPPHSMVSNSAAKASRLIGLRYSPFAGLMLRMSRGTGFVPPTVVQLGTPTVNESALVASLRDPRRGNTVNPMPYVAVSGANPELMPEHSRTTSLGLVVEPERLPGLRASLDYTRMRKTDNIVNLSYPLLLENEDKFPGRVLRGPNLPTDEAGWAGPITYVDVSFVNAASAGYEALDAQLKYGFELNGETYLEFWGNGTWTLGADQQTIAGGPSRNLRGISASFGAAIPLEFRGSYGVTLEGDRWMAGWSVRHYSAYWVADPELAGSAQMLAAQGNRGRVPRQLLHDITGRWRFPHAASESNLFRSFLSDLEVTGGVRNVFNTRPEVDLSNDYHFYSYLVDPRLRTFYVQLKYEF